MLSDSELLAPGAMLGKYELLRRLAVGGMAEIYLGRVSGPAGAGFEKLVVVKRILPRHAVDQQFLRMFLDEARLMATLSHPNITQVYDVGVEGNATFFTMEYVHGEDLRTVIDAAARAGGDGLPLGQAVAIVAGAAAGLHCAHGKEGPDGRPLGIVHRDVSPSNVLISYDGAVKVTDFGVAKWASQETETRHGTLKGKVGYMSPEQCRAEALDRRSDVFALGILLYETTTGVRPFRGDGDFEVMDRIANHEVAPPSAVRGGYPPELERIVLRALRRDREERYASAQEMQLALEELAREQKLVTSPVALGQTMQALFGETIAAWRAARGAGKSLGQHLAESGAGEAAPSISRTATDVHAAETAPSPAAASADRWSRPSLARAAVAGALLLAVALLSAKLLGGGASSPPAPVPAPPPLPSPLSAAASPAPEAVAAVPSSTPAPATRTVGTDPTPTPIRIQKRPSRRGPTAAGQVKVWDPDSPVPP